MLGKRVAALAVSLGLILTQAAFAKTEIVPELSEFPVYQKASGGTEPRTDASRMRNMFVTDMIRQYDQTNWNNNWGKYHWPNAGTANFPGATDIPGTPSIAEAYGTSAMNIAWPDAMEMDMADGESIAKSDYYRGWIADTFEWNGFLFAVYNNYVHTGEFTETYGTAKWNNVTYTDILNIVPKENQTNFESAIAVYDISCGDKEFYGCFTEDDLGIATAVKGRIANIEVTDDYIYLVYDGGGSPNNMELAVFTNTLVRGNTMTETPTLVASKSTGLSRPAKATINYFTEIIGDKFITVAPGSLKDTASSGLIANMIAINDISDIANGNIGNAVNYRRFYKEGQDETIYKLLPYNGETTWNTLSKVNLVDFTTDGKYAYFMMVYKDDQDAFHSKLFITDLRGETPILLGTLDFTEEEVEVKNQSGSINTDYYASTMVKRRIFVYGDLIYSTDNGYINIINIEDKTNPRLISGIDILPCLNNDRRAYSDTTALYAAEEWVLCQLSAGEAFVAQLSEDKTQIVNYAWLQKSLGLGSLNLLGKKFIEYGSKLYYGYQVGAAPVPGVSVIDMSSISPVQLIVDKVEGKTVTGRVFGASGVSVDGEFIDGVREDDNEVYATWTYTAAANAEEISICANEMGFVDYEGTTETVSFSEPAPIVREIVLSSAYSSETITPGTDITASPVLKNTTLSDVSGMAIAALYDGSLLVDVALGSSKTVTAGTENEALGNLVLTVPQTQGNYSIKVFFLKDLRTIKPVAPSVGK